MKPATPHELPLVGLMLGDMTGIGPEICARLLDSKVLNDVAGSQWLATLGCSSSAARTRCQAGLGQLSVDGRH